MQWIAIITMVVDHIGYVWFPEAPIWRIIGRLAFPIYAYYVAVSMMRTRNRKLYVQRLLLLALISQIPFSLLFQTWTVNVIGTFFISVSAIYLMERMTNHPLRYLWVISAALLMEIIPFDYGAYGLVLVLIYRFTSKHIMWISHLGLNLIYAAIYLVPIQMFSIIPTLFFAYSPTPVRRTAPRWLWRSFYPAHLAVLYALTAVIPLPPS